MTDFAITPAQCRGARAMLGMSRRDLAAAAHLAERTIMDFESGARVPLWNTQRAIRDALEGAGARFGDDGCVCLRNGVDEA